jgi:transposase
MQRKEKIVGIDVSKKTLDVALYGTKCHIRISNNSDGFKQLQAWLKEQTIALDSCWFVFEYTGGYEYRLVQFCTTKHITFTRVAGLEIKKSLGMQRGKNDKIDARRISEYGYEKKEKIQPHNADCTAIERMKLFLSQRSGFVKDKKANEQRAKELLAMMDISNSDPLIRHYNLAVAFAQKMIDNAEAEIMKIIAKDEAILRNFQLITSIPGIGNVNAWMTIAYTGNFKRFNNGRAYGAYCGIVPFEHTSGTSVKKKSRVSHMANKEIKAILDMAAKASIAHDPEINAYYKRRQEKGKHHLSIMNEVKFKMVLRMFAVVNKQEFYVKKIKNAA